MDTLDEDYVNVWYLAEFWLEWEMFHTKVNQNTHFMLNEFFPPENRVIYEIMCKNMV